MGWLENLSAEEIVRASRFGLLLPPKGESGSRREHAARRLPAERDAQVPVVRPRD